MLKPIQIQRLENYAKKLAGENYDKIDIKQELIDKELTIFENRRIIKEKIRQLLGVKEQENESRKAKAEELMIQSQINNELRNEEEKIQELNKEHFKLNKDLGDYYIPIEEVIEQMKLGLCHLAFVKGRAGTGKSENIGRYLYKYFKENEIIQVTDVSEAYLFELFYNYNGCIFWFKDVDKLLRGERSLLTLKTSCETKKERIITNYNYSHQQRNLPKSFIFTGKLIFDYNEITNIMNRESFEALISRGEFINLNFSFEEMCDIMQKICDTKDKLMITNWLIENYKFVGFNQFNLRTQQRAFMWYEYAKIKNYDWKEYTKNKLQHNKTQIQQMLYTFMGEKAVRTTELKRWLIRAGIVNTLRTAERRITEYIELGELYKISEDIRNFYVSLLPQK